VSIAVLPPVRLVPLLVVRVSQSVDGWPIALPSFFQVRYRVPSFATKVFASIAPPWLSGQISGWVPTGVNGPSAELEVATPTHWRPDDLCQAV
jgi:hypothetical protein